MHKIKIVIFAFWVIFTSTLASAGQCLIQEGKVLPQFVEISKLHEMHDFLSKYSSRKSEYETRKQFLERITNLESQVITAIKKRTNCDRLFFSIPIDEKRISYDPESQVLAFGGERGLLVPSSIMVDPESGFDPAKLGRGPKAILSYVIRTPLSVQHILNEEKSATRYALSLMVQSKKRIRSFPKDNYVIKGSLEPKAAKDMKENASLLFVVKPTYPFTFSHIKLGENPDVEIHNIVSAVFDEIFIYNSKKRMPYRRLYKSKGPIPPLAWYVILEEINKRKQ